MGNDTFTEKVIGCAIDVHKALGPGLLESTYQKCLAYELKLHNIDTKVEYPIPVEYKGIKLDCGYRVDIKAQNCSMGEYDGSVFLHLIG